jgi:predicted transcriptional regulator
VFPFEERPKKVLVDSLQGQLLRGILDNSLVHGFSFRERESKLLTLPLYLPQGISTIEFDHVIDIFRNMKTIAVTIDETTLKLLDELANAAPQGRSRSALVRTALREFAGRERRRAIEAKEGEVFRKTQQASGPASQHAHCGASPAMRRGEICRTREKGLANAAKNRDFPLSNQAFRSQCSPYSRSRDSHRM